MIVFESLTSNKPIDFGTHRDHDPDPGITNGIFPRCFSGGLRSPSVSSFFSDASLAGGRTLGPLTVTTDPKVSPLIPRFSDAVRQNYRTLPLISCCGENPSRSVPRYIPLIHTLRNVSLNRGERLTTYWKRNALISLTQQSTRQFTVLYCWRIVYRRCPQH